VVGPAETTGQKPDLTTTWRNRSACRLDDVGKGREFCTDEGGPGLKCSIGEVRGGRAYREGASCVHGTNHVLIDPDEGLTPASRPIPTPNSKGKGGYRSAANEIGSMTNLLNPCSIRFGHRPRHACPTDSRALQPARFRPDAATLPPLESTGYER
jgi:hypothetical protein